MSDQVSSLGMFTNTVALMRQSEVQLQQVAQQNATGEVSTSLVGYGAQASTVLDLQGSIQETQSWIDNAAQINDYLTGYNTALGQLGKDATQLQTALNQIGTTGATSTQALQTLIQGLEADVGATLNTQVGDRYIFAGNRYTTAPTVDLTQLAAPTTPQAIVLASGSTTPPTIPNYDTAYAGTSPSGVVASGTSYYAQQQVTVAAGQTMSYGVSADDPTMQQLVYALKQAEAGAASGNSATAQQFFANAKSAVATAIAGLQSLTQQNGDVTSQLGDETATQKQTLSTLQTQLGNITQVDPATVATELSNIENQLNGTYKATSTILNLTLLTYLPT
jgi:flagellar hook-associated protein 3 FlgL